MNSEWASCSCKMCNVLTEDEEEFRGSWFFFLGSYICPKCSKKILNFLQQYLEDKEKGNASPI